MKKLPRQPSKLIRLALADFDVVRKDKRYKIDMAVWHSSCRYGDSDRCSVCLAGAVMANSLKVDISYLRSPNDFDKNTRNAICALNRLRAGLVWDALSYLGYRTVKSGLPEIVRIPEYTNKNYEEWKDSLLKLADRLEKAGF